LSGHVAFLNSKIQCDSVNPGESDESRELLVVFFEKPNRVLDLRLELREFCVAHNDVKS
jgi:hypothetical protein